MDPLIIKPTNTTFQVNLDKSKGVFKISGRSRPENVVGFFEPIFIWFEKYQQDPNAETLVEFSLEYFNSSTAKVLLRFLVKIEEMHKSGMNISVLWKARKNDEDMMETGEDFASLIRVPFDFAEFE